jgi:hypothetical protein
MSTGGIASHLGQQLGLWCRWMSGLSTGWLSLFLCIAVLMLPQLRSDSFVYDVLKPRFERDFRQYCLKFPFVQDYLHQLKHPSGRYVVFVFQQHHQLSGGFGDRLAGLVTAAALALRYNRTLIVHSQSDFFKLFRPYDPDALEDHDAPAYSYNASSIAKWANYSHHHHHHHHNNLNGSDVKHINCLNEDETESCYFLTSEPQQKNIVIRSNRALICKWFHANTTFPAKGEVMKLLGSGNDDLMEAAGCMLRLVMWPTDLLWRMVDEVFVSHKDDLKRKGIMTSHDHAVIWKYLVSAHFRCGDRGYDHQNSTNQYCQHSFQYNITVNGSTKLVYNIPPHEESLYMKRGTPIDFARCAALVLDNLSATSIHAKDSTALEREILSFQSNRSDQNSSRARAPTYFHTIMNIASDNEGAANQINETLQWPNTLVSPSGCHVDLEATYECLRLTAVYWFIMASSDIIVAPGDHSLPNSGFSQYAAIYGLRNDSLRDPKYCDNLVPRYNMSHKHHKTWVC